MVKSTLASEVTGRVASLATVASTAPQTGAKDLIFKVHGDDKGHLRRLEGTFLTGVTACGKFVDIELSAGDSRSIEFDDVCPVCMTLRDFDSWIAANIDL